MGHELPGPPATTIDNKLTILPPSACRLRRADGGRGSPVHGIRLPRSTKAPDTFHTWSGPTGRGSPAAALARSGLFRVLQRRARGS